MFLFDKSGLLVAVFGVFLTWASAGLADGEIADIVNYREYDANFSSSGQPDAAQLKLLSEAGFKRVVYIAGKFLNADLDKASEENERQHFLVERSDGVRIGFTQIAGLVARRIVAFVKEGDSVANGQRIGLIRFGSRVDVYLPHGTSSRVIKGQRCVAGETVIADLGVDQDLIAVAH